MRMVDILAKKRDGDTLTEEEIRFFVDGYTKNDIPDYQASALLMAICLRGMASSETTALTLAMAESGDWMDLSAIPGRKVDKHSTGGVGDKTTLIVAPIVASLGVPVAKMSGRGLGHTGGTIDKLESIPGFSTSLSEAEFITNVRQYGICIAGQTGELAPADKKLYALRDVTATVSSLPLIAASVMSKKLASGADSIVLDVKAGSGALINQLDQARQLAMEMVRIGQKAGRKTVALLTNMDVPLGYKIGNSLEVREAIQTLRGQGPADLTELSIELAANMLFCAEVGDLSYCRAIAKTSLFDGSAYDKFCTLIATQGGDVSYIEQPDTLPIASIVQEMIAPQDGYITHMNSAKIGTASMLLGAGRAEKDSIIHAGAGIVLLRKTGDKVKCGETIARLYSEEPHNINEACRTFFQALQFGNTPPEPQPLIYDRISSDDLDKEE